MGTLALSAGCGDGVLCQSEALVFIVAPGQRITTDNDPSTPGVQTDVRVRTTLLPGTQVALTVRDEMGQMADAVGATIADDGYGLFRNVTVPPGEITLLAESNAGDCGVGSDSLTVNVAADVGCALTLRHEPQENSHYAPLRVLSGASDPDPSAPGFQTTLEVQTEAGWMVELFRSDGGQELSLAVIDADAAGQVHGFATMPEGTQTVRAVCKSPGRDVERLSRVATFFVDTVAPVCEVVDPGPGTTLTAAQDRDMDSQNGLQIPFVGAVGGLDILGESTTFAITPEGGVAVMMDGTLVDASGMSRADLTMAASSGSYNVSFFARDHAGNTCVASGAYRVSTDRCPVSVVAPTAPVVIDVDGNPGNGAQLDVTVDVSGACAGRTVTADCGINNPSAVADAQGRATLRVDMCGAGVCETSDTCTFTVTTADGVPSTAESAVQFDNLAPTVTLRPITPAVPCGGQVTPAQDARATPGVQIRLRMYSVPAPPAAVGREVVLTNANGVQTSPAAATGDVYPTLAGGTNTMVARALDALGNLGESAPCTITLADLAVGFSPVVADGHIGPADGTVVGNNLAFDLCGTVSTADAAVQVAIDGGAPVAANVVGNAWCLPVSLLRSPPVHTVAVSASAAPSVGNASLLLNVDLTPPPAIVGVAALAETRETISLRWTSPSDAGMPVAAYTAKISTTPLTSANFATTGTLIPTGVPLPPGTAEQVVASQLRAGTSYYLGVATLDAAGNRSAVTTVGPIIPAFTQTGAVLAPAPTAGAAFASRIAHGFFNDDEYSDIAVAAPGQNAVHVYFGSASGIAPSPNASFVSATPGVQFGAGLSALRWSSTTRDDLAIGAPLADGGLGRVYVFSGGATFPNGVVNEASAQLELGVNAASPGWFADAQLGANLTRLQFAGDVRDELIVAAPGGGGGASGVVVLHGGTVTSSPVLLSSITAAASGSAVAEVFAEPVTPGSRLGAALVDVGPTAGAGDATADLWVGVSDDAATTGDVGFVLRGGAVPSAPGVAMRPLSLADLRLRYTTSDASTDFGASAGTLADVDGDGVGDFAVGAWRFGDDRGQVVWVRGGISGDVDLLADGAAISVFTGSADGRNLGAAMATGDINNDGAADFMTVGRVGSSARLFAWFAGDAPIATASETSAAFVTTGPAEFALAPPPMGPPAHASWIGDINRDGLGDVCWGAPADRGGEGVFEVLWDIGPDR